MKNQKIVAVNKNLGILFNVFLQNRCFIYNFAVDWQKTFPETPKL